MQLMKKITCVIKKKLSKKKKKVQKAQGEKLRGIAHNCIHYR